VRTCATAVESPGKAHSQIAGQSSASLSEKDDIDMENRTIGVVMNGVTGRMGHRQHLVRSILAIREQGGVELADGSRVQLQPLLVGRNADKLSEMAERYGLKDWTTDVNGAIADDD